jgi:hypothetical protein
MKIHFDYNLFDYNFNRHIVIIIIIIIIIIMGIINGIRKRPKAEYFYQKVFFWIKVEKDPKITLFWFFVSR